MKKLFVTAVVALMVCAEVSAQTGDSDNHWTLNSRIWSTNYFTSLLYDVGAVALAKLVFHADKTAEMIIPFANTVFPVGISNDGLEGPWAVCSPYHRSFANPFKHIGDYGIGVDVSCQPSLFGAYAGAYFKSQEIVFKETDDNLRGYYFQPRAGVMIGNEMIAFEGGMFYDVLTGCGGSFSDARKDMLKGGFGIDLAFSVIDKEGKQKTQLQISLPLHDFLDSGYPGMQGMSRKVGYIMVTRRICL